MCSWQILLGRFWWTFTFSAPWYEKGLLGIPSVCMYGCMPEELDRFYSVFKSLSTISQRRMNMNIPAQNIGAIQMGPRNTTWWFSQKGLKHVRFEVFMVVTMKNAVIWVVAPCPSFVDQCFRGTLVHTRSARRHIPDNGILQGSKNFC
jgi:hypothetical protein